MKAEKKIGALPAPEIKRITKQSIYRIASITGWEVPANEMLMFLIEEVEFLFTQLKNIGEQELFYACRRYAGDITEFGKAINLIFIKEIIKLYLKDRKNVMDYSEIEKENNEQQKIYTQEELDNIHRADVEAYYQRLRNGWVPEKEPEYFYAILVKDGIVKEGDSLSDWFVKCLGEGKQNIYVKK